MYTNRINHYLPAKKPALVMALFVVFAGALVIVGWIFDITLLKSIRPGWVAMKANTAICFILTGIALWLTLRYPKVSTPNHQVLKSYFALSMTLTAGLIGLLSFAEYVFTLDFGIDQLLFEQAIGEVATSHPGRMAPETAMNFVLLSVAIGLMNVTKSTRFKVIVPIGISLFIITSALSSLLTYLTPSFGTYGWFGLTIISIPTAVLFLILGIAVFISSSKNDAFIWSLNKTSTAIFVFGMAALVFVSINSSRSQFIIKETVRDIAYIEYLRSEILSLEVDVYKTQAQTRGYLITGDRSFMAGYLSAKASSAESLEALRKLVQGKPHEQMLFNKIEIASNKAFQWYQHVVDAKEKGVSNDTLIKLVTHGQVVLQDLSAQFSEVLSHQRQHNQSLQLEYEKAYNFINWSIFSSSLASIIIFMVVIFRLNDSSNEREKAEQQQRENEAYLSSFYKLNLVGLSITALDKGWLRVNEYLCVMLEYSEPELFKLTWADLTHPDDLAADIEQFNRMLAGEIERYTLEKRFISKTGKIIYTELVVSCLRKENGEIDYVLAMVEDISRRKKDELLLINKEQQLTLVLEASYLGFWDWNIVTDKIDRNHIWAEMLGYTFEEIQNTIQQWSDFVHPDDITQAWESINNALEGRTSKHELVYRMRQKNGDYKWVLDRAKVVERDENGKALRMAGTNTDYSEQKIAENNLGIAAAAFESHESIFVTDANGLILKANSAFTETSGFTQAEVLGQNPRMFQSGRHDIEYYKTMWDSIIKTGAWQGEIWNRRKNGEIYPEALTITAVKDRTGVVTNFVATYMDITKSKAATEEIKSLAFYDPLTQLPNRRLLLDRLQQALASSTRNDQQGALLFLDLDHFKTLNDTLGHDIGDLLLQQVAERLAFCVREGDTVARIGGDEFVLLLVGLSPNTLEAAAQTKTIANKILASLNQAYQLGTHEYYNSPSIGITLFNDHEAEIEELLKHADIAMYNAKKEGRNTLRFFDPLMQEAINMRAEMEHDLRNAIAQQHFELYYQVQVDKDGVPLGAEALIRWVHPERGMISPINFIPLAEETGLIVPIGQWVLETACAQLKAWEQNPNTSQLNIAVNVSAKQFNQPEFVSQARATLERYAINPIRLKLELTESMLVDDVNHVIMTMQALNKIGVLFELDDFGTGYSSLRYLKKLPLHQLKIDQSFVRDIETDINDKTLVRTIISMAQSLGIKVIAEGVEQEQQRQLLLENGCFYYQGYLFGEPIPIDKFEILLKKMQSH